jgi:predicted RNase H-like HicB family nuclease
MRYVVLVDGRPGAYSVTVPDLPGCTAMGRTIEEAHRNIIAAVTVWAGGEKLPPPRSIDELRKDPDVAAVLALAMSAGEEVISRRERPRGSPLVRF